MASIVAIETEVEQGEGLVDREASLKAEEQYRIFLDRWQQEHRDYVDRGDRYERFYRGDQWDEKDLKMLEKSGRPALTLNLILSTINTFLGEQITRRVDLQYRPVKDASKDEAHALSALAMAILDSNQYDWKETEMVEDGAIRDRGFLNFRVNFDDNLQGDIQITNVHPSNVILEKHVESYDPKDWPGVIFAEWYSLDEVEARFGTDKVTELERSAVLTGTLGSDSLLFDRDNQGHNGPDDPDGNPWEMPLTSDERRRQIKAVRVLDRQFYRNTRIFVLVDQETLEQRELPPGTPKKKAEVIASKLGVVLRAKTVRRLYWRVTADKIVLWEGWSPYKTPTLIPYFPYFRKGEAFGIVKNLISPQEQYNKVSSQELHIVNSTANGGWKVKRGSLLNMTLDDLAERGSQTGVVLELNDLNGADKIQPNQIPTGITNIKRDTQLAVRNIAGFSDTFVGADGDEVSGIAMKAKTNRGQVQIQKPLDNLARTRYLVGRKLLELIQGFYTDARIIQTTDYTQPGMPQQEVAINMPQEDGSVLNDFTRGMYETNIATMPARDNYDDAQFAEILNMRSVGINIPDYHVVRYSHLAQKDAIAEELKALAGLQAPTEEEMQLQAMQQQLALRDMAASIAEKEARAQELMSKIDLNTAKAANESTEADRELFRLLMELQKERESYRVRMQLAQMQGIQKMDAIGLTARADLLKQTVGAQHASRATE